MMKKSLFTLISMSFFGAILAGVAFGNNAAIVDQNPGEPGFCIIFEDQHGITDAGPLFTDHVLEVWNNGGQVNFVCQGTLPEGVEVEPGYMTSGWQGCLATPQFECTTDTSFKANRGGRWTVKLKFSGIELQ